MIFAVKDGGGDVADGVPEDVDVEVLLSVLLVLGMALDLCDYKLLSGGVVHAGVRDVSDVCGLTTRQVVRVFFRGIAASSVVPDH